MFKPDTIKRIISYSEKKAIDPLVAEELRHYVYALYAPGEKYPFYVGKGCGERVLHHFSEALQKLLKSDSPDLANAKLNSIFESFINANSEPEIRIIRRNLDEEQAKAVEGALIDALQPSGNRVRGLDSVKSGMILLDELIIEKGAKPIFPSSNYSRIHLYNIEQGYHQRGCYDTALRGHWKSNRFISNLNDFRARGGTAYAVGLIRGISRHVIELHAWEPSLLVLNRLQMVGPEVVETELLHKRWTQIIRDSAYWKRGNGLVLELRQESGISGYRILHGQKAAQFQPLHQAEITP